MTTSVNLDNLADIPDDWQHDQLKVALQYCKKFDLALDCGAHRGVTVNFLVNYFKQVVAFEPTHLAHEINKAAVVHNVALGKEASKGGLMRGKHNTGQTYIVDGDAVDILPLDSFWLMPDFIKLDVEGMEAEVLLGAERTIKNAKPVIMFEENGLSLRRGVGRGETGKILESWGMRKIHVFNEGNTDEDWLYSF